MKDQRKQLLKEGFTKVERDDRLLDVFPKETPDKGVELWDKWSRKGVQIIRLWNGQQTRHTFPTEQIEQALQKSKRLNLN